MKFISQLLSLATFLKRSGHVPCTVSKHTPLYASPLYLRPSVCQPPGIPRKALVAPRGSVPSSPRATRLSPFGGPP